MHWGDDEHIHAVFRSTEKRQLGGRSSKHLECAAVGVCVCVYVFVRVCLYREMCACEVIQQ